MEKEKNYGLGLAKIEEILNALLKKCKIYHTLKPLWKSLKSELKAGVSKEEINFIEDVLKKLKTQEKRDGDTGLERIQIRNALTPIKEDFFKKIEIKEGEANKNNDIDRKEIKEEDLAEKEELEGLEEEEYREFFSQYNIQVKDQYNFTEMSSIVTIFYKKYEDSIKVHKEKEKEKKNEQNSEELSRKNRMLQSEVQKNKNIIQKQQTEINNLESIIEEQNMRIINKNKSIDELQKKIKLTESQLKRTEKIAIEKEKMLKVCFSRETIKNFALKLNGYIKQEEQKELNKFNSYLWSLIGKMNSMVHGVKFLEVSGHVKYQEGISGEFEFALDIADPNLSKEKKQKFLQYFNELKNIIL